MMVARGKPGLTSATDGECVIYHRMSQDYNTGSYLYLTPHVDRMGWFQLKIGFEHW